MVGREQNPVVETCRYALQATNLVQLNHDGISAAAAYIYARMRRDAYTPRVWLEQPLHLCPPEPYDASAPGTRATLDWIFLVSALNFSFWSPLAHGRYGVEWRAGWGLKERMVHTGYWCLPAAIDRALEEGIPFTDPAFYADEKRCPDSLVEHVFRGAPGCREPMPLLKDRIAVMRACGRVLCKDFGGSFQGLIDRFHGRFGENGSALDLVKMVVDAFPQFQDEVNYAGRTVHFWKRAQILVAETWAAFYPAPSSEAQHPLLPRGVGALTMFADYRVPQVLHHLRMLRYPSSLVKALTAHIPFANGSREEVSVRAASVLAVERVRDEIIRLREKKADGDGVVEVSSVLIDFYLWELAKNVESGMDRVEGLTTNKTLPAHRTRSIWY